MDMPRTTPSQEQPSTKDVIDVGRVLVGALMDLKSIRQGGTRDVTGLNLLSPYSSKPK